MKRLVLAALAVVLLTAGLLAFAVFSPYAGFHGEVFVDIPRGTGGRRIGEMLAGAGIIRHPAQFVIVRSLRPGTRLQAGEYRFSRAASAWQVFDRIARGDIFYHELAVPEGQNMFDIAASLERQRIMPAEAFLQAARDPAPIRDLDPRAPSLEGYLFPDTYHFGRHTTGANLVRQMTARFRQVWKSLGAGADVHDTVTLASLVEKETSLAQERPVVASVFFNRLRAGMPLQCDPTTIYAALLEERYRGGIYRSDLSSKQEYNTYQHAGLPPGPIANPGLESLKAALKPAQTDYIYFVALPDGSGGHEFSTELSAHSRAVARYRRALKALEADSNGRVSRDGAAGGDRPR